MFLFLRPFDALFVFRGFSHSLISKDMSLHAYNWPCRFTIFRFDHLFVSIFS